MELISSNYPSTLNPKAAMFVPSSYRMVEDFSPKWWELVQTSPCFRDYWLEERYSDSHITLDLVPDAEEPVFSDDDFFSESDKTKEKNSCQDLISVGALKWNKPRLFECPKYFNKAPKIVSTKVSPRTIQQPR